MAGLVHRMMPPTDYNCGEVPPECYDLKLTRNAIRIKLEEVYLAPEKIKQLIEASDYKDNPNAEVIATLQLEFLADIDAGTIWHII